MYVCTYNYGTYQLNLSHAFNKEMEAEEGKGACLLVFG